jgi:hypothetical protein
MSPRLSITRSNPTSASATPAGEVALPGQSASPRSKDAGIGTQVICLEAAAVDWHDARQGLSRHIATTNVFSADTRECLVLVADTSLPGLRVARELDAVI